MANYEGTKLQDIEGTLNLDELRNGKILIVTEDNQYLITLEQLKQLLGVR